MAINYWILQLLFIFNFNLVAQFPEPLDSWLVNHFASRSDLAFKGETTQVNDSVEPCRESKTKGSNWKINDLPKQVKILASFFKTTVFFITSFWPRHSPNWYHLKPEKRFLDPASTAAIFIPIQCIETSRLHTWRPEVLESRAGKSYVSRALRFSCQVSAG